MQVIKKGAWIFEKRKNLLAFAGCRDAFRGAYDKCFEVVTWVAGWILCWPMKLTFVCDITMALGGRQICDPEGKIEPGLGQGYATLKGG